MATTDTRAAERALHPVERAWLLLVYTLETHGWTLLFALAALYVLRERYRAWAAERARRRSLQQANDPSRVAVLQRDAARVREKQQQAMFEAAHAKRRSKAT